MAQQEVLSLVAQVVDKYSGPIAQMRASLDGLTQRNVASHKAGRQAALAHEKAFSDLRKSVKETGEHVKGILEPAFVGLGISVISTGAAIAGVTAAIKGFADSSRSLEFARKETGLAIKLLREYEALAPTIGSTPEAMDQGFRKLAGNLDQWRHRLGPFREFFASRFGEGAGYIRSLGEELVHTTDNAKALSKINALAAMMPKESERRAFYEAMGLDPNLARKKGKELTDALAAIGKRIGELTPADEAKGLAVAEAFDRIRESVSKLKTEIGSELAPAMTEATDAVRTFISAHGEDLRKVFVDVAHAIETAPWAKWGNDIRDAAKSVDGVVQTLGGWKLVMEGLIAIKLVNFVAPVAALGLAATRTAASLAAMGATLTALTAPAWLLALLAGVSAKALIETVRPQPLNKGEDEFARQKKYGLQPKDEDKGVHAAARSIRKKISAPADETSHYGRLTPISYSGKTDAASFGKEDAAERAILKGTFEGTRTGVIAAFKEWVESRRQGAGGFTNTNYQPGASGGVGGGGGAGIGAPEGSIGGAGEGGAGTRSWRNKNPGNIKFGAFAKEHGAVGADSGGFAVFPDEAAGSAAQRSLWESKGYKDVPFASALPKWSGSGYGAKALGVNPGGTFGSLSEDQKKKFLESQRRAEGWRAAGSSSGQGAAAAMQDSAEHIRGLLAMEGNGYQFGSGGGGHRHIPFGDYPVTPETIGPWGTAHGAIGINGNQIYDPILKRMRSGIELHAGSSDQLLTEGCMAIAGPQWPQFKARLKGMIGKYGRVFLHVGKNGASITPQANSLAGAREWADKQHRAHPGLGQPNRKSDGLNVNLMRSAREAQLVHTPQKVIGDASLKISMHGFPKGTKTESKINGMFKTLTMYRGLAAPMADQEG
jgi:hypothetical protein